MDSKKFEINTYLLNKIGWISYSPNRGIGHPKYFLDDDYVKLFIDIKDSKICYLIKELIYEKSYIFIILDYNDYNNPKIKIEPIKSNLDIFKLVIKHEATTNKMYKRNFKINKVLK